jgi:hypothetical protein
LLFCDPLFFMPVLLLSSEALINGVIATVPVLPGAAINFLII